MPPSDTSDPTWQSVIEDFRRSGLTQAEFCSRRGLPVHTFRRRLYGRPGPSLAQSAALPPPVTDPTPSVLPRFLPVTLVADSTAVPPETHPDPIVLILDARRRIAVAPGFDVNTLRRLIEAIEARP